MGKIIKTKSGAIFLIDKGAVKAINIEASEELQTLVQTESNNRSKEV